MEYSELKCPICGNTSVQKIVKNTIEELISLNFCELSDKRYDDVINGSEGIVDIKTVVCECCKSELKILLNVSMTIKAYLEILETKILDNNQLRFDFN
jgi:hypothetical protein